jgi:hypothetical protein
VCVVHVRAICLFVFQHVLVAATGVCVAHVHVCAICLFVFQHALVAAIGVCVCCTCTCPCYLSICVSARFGSNLKGGERLFMATLTKGGVAQTSVHTCKGTELCCRSLASTNYLIRCVPVARLKLV